MTNRSAAIAVLMIAAFLALSAHAHSGAAAHQAPAAAER